MKLEIVRSINLVAFLFAITACASSSLLENVSLDPETISPRAGSANAATILRYSIARDATVSIYLMDAQGQPKFFRKEQPRIAGDYQTAFSGAIDDRVLPDGKYTLVIEAKENASGRAAK